MRRPTLDAICPDPIRRLGRGAFGEVFLVRAVGDRQEGADDGGGGGELLALKRVPVARLSESGVDKALAEATLLSRLGEAHDCILRCFDFRVTAGPMPALELLLEFASLGDLGRRLHLHRDSGCSAEGHGLPEAEAVAYGHDIASGLAHLHALRPKVFHRDVKPANVVLCRAGDSPSGRGTARAKLADFGVAKVLETEASQAGTATVIGTPHYLSPEILQGEIYDERGDAWALGCVLYEMICLHRPFHKAEGHMWDLALRISEGQYDREALVEARAGHYSGSLIAAVVGLLAVEPGQRHRAHDAARLLHELRGELPHVLPVVCWPPLPTTPQEEVGAPAKLDAGCTDSWNRANATEHPDTMTRYPPPHKELPPLGTSGPVGDLRVPVTGWTSSFQIAGTGYHDDWAAGGDLDQGPQHPDPEAASGVSTEGSLGAGGGLGGFGFLQAQHSHENLGTCE